MREFSQIQSGSLNLPVRVRTALVSLFVKAWKQKLATPKAVSQRFSATVRKMERYRHTCDNQCDGLSQQVLRHHFACGASG
ncbi:hypothetical protein CROQUDRAFT_95125 [Cronartium quercuum f. sp. fusiforme G11]|uniref:Uncharacterized protein n=1 Tax=Cronartium quercuum f. sp. fusiforme G11 TaxID=708437 RepID=A0A9P6T9M3_9BASI|nr:hypothetical protein CROQUDRAFT_95125 [Cronartium quercuum f. sp. fusiforme G11]